MNSAVVSRRRFEFWTGQANEELKHHPGGRAHVGWLSRVDPHHHLRRRPSLRREPRERYPVGLDCGAPGVATLTLRLMRQARDQQMRLAALRPAIEALQRRHAKDPARVMHETQALYAKHGIRLFSAVGLIGLLIQLPLLGGLFAAVRAGLGARVRFLWVADLARPDAFLITAVTLLTAGAMTMTPAAPGQTGATTQMLLLLAVGGTFVFLWSASSAVALSVGAGSVVSTLLNWLLTRDGLQVRRGG